MAKQFNVATVFTLSDKFSPVLSSMGNKVDRWAAGAKAAFRSVAPEANRLTDIIKGVTIGNILTKTISATAGLIKNNIGAAIEYQSSLIETQNVVNTVFGENSKVIDKWATSTAKKYGLVELQAKQYAGTFASMFGGAGITGDMQAGMSMKMAQVVGDFASMYNLQRDDAMQKILSAMAGHSQPLQIFGINMIDKNLDAFAKAKGIRTAYKDMDQLNKTMIRFQYLVENPVIKNSLGDYQKPIASWAVSSQDAMSAIAEMRGKLVDGLLPVLIQAADYIKGLAERIGEWAVKNKEKITELFQSLFDKLKWLFEFTVKYGPTILKAFAAFKIITTVTKAVGTANTVMKSFTVVTGFAAQAAAMAGTSAVGAASGFSGLIAAIGGTVAALGPLLAIVLTIIAATAGVAWLLKKGDEAEKREWEKSGVKSKANFDKARDDADRELAAYQASFQSNAGKEGFNPNLTREDFLEREYNKYRDQGLVSGTVASFVKLENEGRTRDPNQQMLDEAQKMTRLAEEQLKAINGTTAAVDGLKGRGRAGPLSYSQMGEMDIWAIARAGY